MDQSAPLLCFPNHYVVAPLLPLDDFGIRLLPASFGVLAIPTFYFVARRLIGTRAAFLGTFLLTLSPVHLIYSQFGALLVAGVSVVLRVSVRPVPRTP